MTYFQKLLQKKSRIQVYDRVLVQVWDQVNHQVLGWRVRDQVKNQVKDQVLLQVRVVQVGGKVKKSL